MSSRVLHVRLDADCAQAVVSLAEEWGRSISGTLRALACYALSHPDLYPEGVCA